MGRNRCWCNYQSSTNNHIVSRILFIIVYFFVLSVSFLEGSEIKENTVKSLFELSAQMVIASLYKDPTTAYLAPDHFTQMQQLIYANNIPRELEDKLLKQELSFITYKTVASWIKSDLNNPFNRLFLQRICKEIISVPDDTCYNIIESNNRMNAFNKRPNQKHSIAIDCFQTTNEVTIRTKIKCNIFNCSCTYKVYIPFDNPNLLSTLYKHINIMQTYFKHRISEKKSSKCKCVLY